MDLSTRMDSWSIEKQIKMEEKEIVKSIRKVYSKK